MHTGLLPKQQMQNKSFLISWIISPPIDTHHPLSKKKKYHPPGAGLSVKLLRALITSSWFGDYWKWHRKHVRELLPHDSETIRLLWLWPLLTEKLFECYMVSSASTMQVFSEESTKDFQKWKTETSCLDWIRGGIPLVCQFCRYVQTGTIFHFSKEMGSKQK